MPWTNINDSAVMKDFACGGAMCAENLMLERGVRLVADIMEIVMWNM